MTANTPGASAQLTGDTYPQGTILADRYRIVRALGEGGMGQVYECEHVEVHRRLAVKVLQPWLTSHAVAKRFKTEARAASAAGHPNIVDVIDAGTLDDGRAFIAMEYIEGPTLFEAVFDAKGIPWQRAAKIGSQVARALDAAHAVGVIHRDLKPENVLLTMRDGVEAVKVVDFGIAFESSPEAGPRPTQAGMAVGTPDYMSPEQARGLPGTPTFDIYALGVLLYEMVAAKTPFTANTAVGLLEMKANQRAPSLTDSMPDIPPAFARLVADCLERDSIDRPVTAADVADRLDKLESQERPTSEIVSAAAAPEPPPETQRRPWVVLVSLVLLAAAVGAVVALASRDKPSRVAASLTVLPFAIERLGNRAEPESPSVVEPEELVEPEPEPEPSTAKTPRNTGKRPPDPPKPAVEVATPEPKPAQPSKPKAPPANCRGVQERGRQARDKHLWAPMLDALSRSECWSNKSERKKLRVLGLKETGKFSACVKAADGSKDQEVISWAALCEKRVNR